MDAQIPIADLRTRLQQFLEKASEKRIHALYTLFQEEIEEELEITEEEWAEILRDRERYLAGELNGKSWEDVLAAVRNPQPAA